MEYENIVVSIENEIAVVKINRPDALNAINSATVSELLDCFRMLSLNDGVHVIILTGEGKAFVAGGDISEMLHKKPVEAREFAQRGQALLAFIENMERPVIAAVNGYALGGGCELCMACDLRVASNRATFGQPEVKLGLIPGWAGTQRLPRLVGLAKAKELILTGDSIDAETASRIGLVNQVVPHDELMDMAKKIARKIASMGPTATRLAKASMNRGVDSDIFTGAAYEAEAFGICFSTGEPKEGISAFLEKRQPDWKKRG
ncbi:crotonase [candidate division TA06 bacterium DG_26]|uniref:Crotonase n=1 Tax=candidate division TA06 bacterium DG_26 TaxID=1703771 RepID=A0A0S7WJN9_UNCT6|nr:MAG: crotonase [candidate division TA06 bacterium DG_26]